MRVCLPIPTFELKHYIMILIFIFSHLTEYVAMKPKVCVCVCLCVCVRDKKAMF